MFIDSGIGRCEFSLAVFNLPDLLVEVGQFAINLLPPVEVLLNFGVHVHFVL